MVVFVVVLEDYSKEVDEDFAIRKRFVPGVS